MLNNEYELLLTTVIELDKGENEIESKFEIGKHISDYQEKYNPKNFFKTLSQDLDARQLKGVSEVTLRRISKFYSQYKDLPELFEMTKKIGWGINSNIIYLDSPTKQRYYLQKAIENNWVQDDYNKAVKSDLDKPMPDKFIVKSLTIKDIKCFSEAFVPFHEQVTLLKGVNARGKSTILQLLAIGLALLEEIPLPTDTANNWKEVIKKGAEQGEFSIELLHNDSLIDLQFSVKEKNNRVLIECLKGKEELHHLRDKFFLVGYSANRIGKTKDINPAGSFEPVATLFNENGYLKRISTSDTHSIVSNYFEVIKELINSIFDKADPDYKVRLVRFTHNNFYFETSNSLDKLPFESMSDGYKGTFIWLLDCLVRMIANGFNILHYKKLAGIVLIDEIDLHLHPFWQRTILPSLRETFPQIQFIIATHSPLVIQSLEKGMPIVSLEDETDDIKVVPEVWDTELSYTSTMQEIMNVEFAFGEQTQKEYQKFESLKEKLILGENVDKKSFKKLVLDLASRGEELQGLMRSHIRELKLKGIEVGL